ncbi:CBS domain-containing protein [Nonomuraea sp. NPDC004186]|uniref:CBS domain-containing protein n=1 Tax=Nonomuraea sp. NPDC049625 TaxID=3155775 RepID=UPI003434BB0A
MGMTVEDVMTSKVVSVTANTPFKALAETLVSNGVSAVPVLDDDNHVIGVVSEADLLCKEEFREQFYLEGYRPPLRTRLRHPKSRQKARGDTAANLMTSPAITVPLEAPAVAAARLMETHGVKRLPVIDYNGRLQGIVSRCDLVKLFLRGDEEIAAEVRDDILGRTLWFDTSGMTVSVNDGVVTLSGRMEHRAEAAIAVRVVGNVNGVVSVVDELAWKIDDSAWQAG